MKKIVLVAALAAVSLAACNGFKKTGNGLEFKMFKDNHGTKAKKGDFLTMHIVFRTDKDSVFYDSGTIGQSPRVPYAEPSFKGSFEEGFDLLGVGDSVRFLVSSDSMLLKLFNNRATFLKKGSKMKIDMKVEKIQSRDEIEKEFRTEMTKRMSDEKIAIDQYIKDNNITATPTATGLYYIEIVKGKGAKAEAGKTVSLKYSGKFLNGKEFDSSEKNGGKPFEFVLGQGNVVAGWDEGVALMKEGGKAKFIIPSALAYGSRGAGGVIPPYTPLVFEAELIAVKSGK